MRYASQKLHIRVHLRNQRKHRFHYNAHVLRTKSNKTFSSLMGTSSSIVAVTETFLSSDHVSASFILDNFIVYRADTKYSINSTKNYHVLLALRKKMLLVSFSRSDLKCFLENGITYTWWQILFVIILTPQFILPS